MTISPEQILRKEIDKKLEKKGWVVQDYKRIDFSAADCIASHLSVVDQLEQTIKENLQKAEALRQSILKKAFCGELINRIRLCTYF